MDISEIIFLAGAGIIGGAINAVAGGGTFITFPAMMAVGLDPLTANASNSVAIYPGHTTAMVAYRNELKASGRILLARCVIAFLGGLIGAMLLLYGGNAAFSDLIPWLLLSATIIFAAGPSLHWKFDKIRFESRALTIIVEFVFAIYGGYFGAGLGGLLMAALSILGVKDLQMASAQKNLLATVISTLSATTFVIAEVIAWPETLSVLVGATVGGHSGARIAKYLSPNILRTAVVLVGSSLSLYYFTF